MEAFSWPCRRWHHLLFVGTKEQQRSTSKKWRESKERHRVTRGAALDKPGPPARLPGASGSQVSSGCRPSTGSRAGRPHSSPGSRTGRVLSLPGPQSLPCAEKERLVVEVFCSGGAPSYCGPRPPAPPQSVYPVSPLHTMASPALVPPSDRSSP